MLKALLLTKGRVKICFFKILRVACKLKAS